MLTGSFVPKKFAELLSHKGSVKATEVISDELLFLAGLLELFFAQYGKNISLRGIFVLLMICGHVLSIKPNCGQEDYEQNYSTVHNR